MSVSSLPQPPRRLAKNAKKKKRPLSAKEKAERRDLVGLHLSDLGGLDNTSEAERSIIRRASVMTVELEVLEARFAAAGHAEPADLDLYQRTAGGLRRLFEVIGLGRRSKDITPTLQEYLEAKQPVAIGARAEDLEEVVA